MTVSGFKTQVLFRISICYLYLHFCRVQLYIIQAGWHCKLFVTGYIRLIPLHARGTNFIFGRSAPSEITCH